MPDNQDIRRCPKCLYKCIRRQDGWWICQGCGEGYTDAFWDKCVGCGQILPAEQLYYEGVEPDVHSPRCWWCIVKQAQELYGEKNVRLGNES